MAGWAGLAVAGCGGDGPEGARAGRSTTPAAPPPTTPPALTGELQFVAMAAGLEAVAVAVYQAAVNAITSSRLTDIPPSVVAFAKTAQQQHRDHASAFNGILIRAGRAAVTRPNEVVQPYFSQGVAQARSFVDLARLARVLENTAAATYQDGVNRLSDKRMVTTLASIQPVEREHAAILSFLLGDYPVPDTYSSATKKGEEARPASDYRG